MKVLVSGLAVVAAVRGWLAVRAEEFTSLPDEVGFLGNAILIGRGDEVPMGFAPFYKGLYGALLAPLAALIEDRTTLAASARLVNVALLAATGLAVWVLLGRLSGPDDQGRDSRLWVDPRPWADPRAWAAVGATAVPGLWVAGLRVWPDALLALGWVAALLALAALAEPGRPLVQRVWLGPIVAALAATHDRFLPVAVLALALIVARLVVLPRVADAVNIVGGFVVVAAGLAVDSRVRTRWDRVADGALTRTLDDPVAALTDGFGALVGQLWYLSAGTFGLAPIGLVVLVAMFRRAKDGPALLSDPRRLTIAAAVVGTVAVQLATALQVGKAHAYAGRPNFDLWANGRYQEVVLVPLVAVGLMTVGRLVRGPGEGVTAFGLGALAAATVVLGAVTTVVLGSGPPVVDRFNIAGATWALDLWPSSPAVIPTVVAATVLGALAFLVPPASGSNDSTARSGRPYPLLPVVPIVAVMLALNGWWVGEQLVTL